MLLTKEIITKWNPTTRKYYESLGHVYTKHNDDFIVPIEHLLVSSNVEIEITCDYCGEKATPKTFSIYNSLRKKMYIKKDACSKCLSIKRKEELQYKQDNNLLAINDAGYWTFHENRLLEFKKYIDEFKTIDNMKNNKAGKHIYQNIINYNESMHDMVVELGYTLDEYSTLNKQGCYKDFSKIENKIRVFIKNNNRFPSRNEMTYNLRIGSRYIDSLGGIYEIKRIMNYFDDNDLVDDRMFVNLSMLEFILAQYLIHNNISYRREGAIDKTKSKRCRYDFYLTDFNLYIEVWGFEENDTKLSKNYHKNRKYKESLYEKLNYNLLSIEHDELCIHDLKTTINTLNNKFSNIFNVNEDIKESSFISCKTISDKDILDKILEVPHENGFLPKLSEVENYDLGYLSRIIRKRHKSYYNFSKIMGFKIHSKLMDRSEMNTGIVFEVFENILLHSNVDIEKETLKNTELRDQINYWLGKNGGMINVKLDFYTMLIDKYKYIDLPESTMYFIYGVLKNKREKDMGRSSEEQIIIAKNILINLILNNEKNKTLFDEVSSRYRNKIPMTDQEYKENFLNVTNSNDYFKLIPKGFDEFSEMSSRGYVNHFKMHWVDIVKIMGKFIEYDEYIINEYKNYLLNNKDDYTLEKFYGYHQYITNSTLLRYRSREDWLDITKSKVNKKRHNDNDLMSNFIKVKNEFGRVPIFAEFDMSSNISITTYANRLNLKGKVYDNVVKLYTSETEYEQYLVFKKIHKSEVGKITGAMARVLSDEDLKNNFHTTFASYKNEFGKFPSRREFSKHSNYDESTYRGRLNLPWLQVVEFYGFKKTS